MSKFLAGPMRNVWISDNPIGKIEIYVRKGIHNINGRQMRTFDIANINVQENFRGRGLGSAIINKIHENNPFESTFIECIQNNALYDHLKKEGWIDVDRSYPPSVFKLTGK